MFYFYQIDIETHDNCFVCFENENSRVRHTCLQLILNRLFPSKKKKRKIKKIDKINKKRKIKTSGAF